MRKAAEEAKNMLGEMKEAPEEKKVAFSRKVAANKLSICLRTLDSLIAHQEIDIFRIGRGVRIPATAIDKVLKTKRLDTHNHRKNGNR